MSWLPLAHAAGEHTYVPGGGGDSGLLDLAQQWFGA
jgi:hypothetical protein